MWSTRPPEWSLQFFSSVAYRDNCAFTEAQLWMCCYSKEAWLVFFIGFSFWFPTAVEVLAIFLFVFFVENQRRYLIPALQPVPLDFWGGQVFSCRILGESCLQRCCPTKHKGAVNPSGCNVFLLNGQCNLGWYLSRKVGPDDSLWPLPTLSILSLPQFVKLRDQQTINFEEDSLEPLWRKKTVFLCVPVKLQTTRNKLHSWQSGRDSPLIEMAPIQCHMFTEQSSWASSLPSLWGCLCDAAHLYHIAKLRKGNSRKNSRHQGALACGWT